MPGTHGDVATWSNTWYAFLSEFGSAEVETSKQDCVSVWEKNL